jgi:hypothetical protein
VARLTASGAYLLSGHDGAYALERFTCGPDEHGWRYDATREDPGTGAPLGRLELHLTGSQVRLHVEAGRWVLRGAAAGGEVLWRRGDQDRVEPGDGFTGTSPAFLVVASRLGTGRLRLVEVTEPVLATRSAVQAWRLPDEEDHDGVAVAAYDVADLSTGERRTVRLTGEVVVQAPGVRLTALTLP